MKIPLEKLQNNEEGAETLMHTKKRWPHRKFFTCLIAFSRRSLGGGNGNPSVYSCLKKSHEQKSLVGYSPWSLRVYYMTEEMSLLNLSLNRASQCQGYPLRGILPHREKVCRMQISSLLLWTSLSLFTDDPCSLHWHWTKLSEPRAPTPISPPQGWCRCCAEFCL